MATEAQSNKLRDYFETKARAGDSGYAIAYALLELAEAQKSTARALDRIGFNDAKPVGSVSV